MKPVKHPDSDLDTIIQSRKATGDSPNGMDILPNHTHDLVHHWRRLQTARDFWDEYSFEIVAVVVAVILLAYTIAGLYTEDYFNL